MFGPLLIRPASGCGDAVAFAAGRARDVDRYRLAAHRYGSRPASGIPAGRCDRTNDKRARGMESGARPLGGETPAGCHWNAWLLAARAPCAGASETGILRVFETSLTSISALRGRSVSGMRSARPDHQPSRGDSRRHQSLCPAVAPVRPTSSDWRYQWEYCPCAFIRVKRRCPGRDVPDHYRQVGLTCIRVKRILSILRGGWLLSSPEVRRISWTSHIRRLPAD